MTDLRVTRALARRRCRTTRLILRRGVGRPRSSVFSVLVRGRLPPGVALGMFCGSCLWKFPRVHDLLPFVCSARNPVKTLVVRGVNLLILCVPGVPVPTTAPCSTSPALPRCPNVIPVAPHSRHDRLWIRRLERGRDWPETWCPSWKCGIFLSDIFRTRV